MELAAMKSLRTSLFLFGLPAVLFAFMPARHGLLLLDRTAVFAGQIWRLWSGHWVHFSASHLVWNLAVLLAAGAWIERVRPGLLLRHILLAAPFISVVVLACEPALQAYGGLSGLATGVVVLLALHQLRTPGSLRWLWAAVLALVAVKTLHDTTHAAPWLTDYGRAGVRSSRTAHAAGASAALLHYLGGRLLTAVCSRSPSTRTTA
jgi:rhomboid family GlyGly-CTERM serine protease